MVIGLTGGMGCGKSTAAGFFAEFGYTRIDSDDLVRRVILADPTVEAEAARRFGPGVLTNAGRINRSAIAHEVFPHEEKLQQWEELIHPRLYALWRASLAANPAGNWVIEVPLLHEKRLEKWFDFIVCVATTSARQYARLAERGLPPALAEQRISKQLPLAQKIELADFVLSNDGSLKFLRDQIQHLIARPALHRAA